METNYRREKYLLQGKKIGCIALAASLAIMTLGGCKAQAEQQNETSISADSTEATAHEHNFINKVVQPTCTEKGYTEHRCSVCQFSYRDHFTPATGHKFGEWTVISEATVESEGERQRTCSECGKVESEIIPKVVKDTETEKPEKNQETSKENTKVPEATESHPAETMPKETEAAITEPPVIETSPAETEVPVPPAPAVPVIEYSTNPGGWKMYHCSAYAMMVIDVRSWGGDDLSVSLVDNGMYFRYTNQAGEVIEETAMSENNDGYAVSVFIEEDGTITYERNRAFS